MEADSGNVGSGSEAEGHKGESGVRVLSFDVVDDDDDAQAEMVVSRYLRRLGLLLLLGWF